MEKLIGSWNMNAFEVESPEGIRLGKWPKPGIAIYSSDGFFSVAAGADVESQSDYPSIIAKDIFYSGRYAKISKNEFEEEYLYHTYKERVGKKRRVSIEIIDHKMVLEFSHREHLLRFFFIKS